MEISRRLSKVAEYVSGETVADIGCDHGKLGAYLLEQGIAQTVYATDISEDALTKARQLKEQLGLEGMALRQGDGLQPLINKRLDTCIFCGIGSVTIAQILERDKKIAREIPRFIFCPLKNTHRLRKYLSENGYCMVDEDLVFENNKYYNIFVAGQGEWLPFDDVEMYVGRRLIEKNDPLLLRWLKKREREVAGNLRRLQKNAVRDVEKERVQLNRQLMAFRKGISLCVQ